MTERRVIVVGEVDARTIASQRVDGLYFAGEMLDMDAGAGGDNLEVAFSASWVADRSATRKGQWE